jgi:hypothetical protein
LNWAVFWQRAGGIEGKPLPEKTLPFLYLSLPIFGMLRGKVVGERCRLRAAGLSLNQALFVVSTKEPTKLARVCPKPGVRAGVLGNDAGDRGGVAEQIRVAQNRIAVSSPVRLLRKRN